MKQLATATLLGLIITIFSCQTNDPTPATNDFSSVDAFIEENASAYANQVVVLVSQNGKLIYKKEHNLTTKDAKAIASASKWLSGGVIMSLVDEGKLSLNDTVGKYLPLFTKYKKGNITIRQLFSHTSGFPGDSPEGYEYNTSFTLAQAVDTLATHTATIHAPGTTFNYGSIGMHIAGRIAEIVSGKSWQTLFNDKIGNPCNLTVTYLSLRNPIIAGGGFTTAEDYLHFLEMIANKGMYQSKRVLSENAIAEMLKDQTNNATIEGTPYPANPYSIYKNTGIRYGMGNWLDVVDSNGTVWETSSPGLFGTHPWQDSKNKIAGIIFTKTDPKISNMVSLQIREKIRNIVEGKTN
ncbi:serine hydrolase domain-containing protein [Emticicia agri]|uniref:Class A beta-lactamase-related serine hydrolase n=1 Tax=Emticicia agri TaxID=2492393 RepID=A0A4Q5M5G1_9BACT|nr:serine hydrolase domain-containing protein [Emticicia agri]RYU97485.1 class A beta-lactamase-related serine hydrolase [Emticicia agri]